MRIIGGEFRSRRLLAPKTDATRPITDRAKQSLFDILGSRVSGAVVYDCFAGTGSMGLECLSRGAERATFFESDRSAAALLRKNIEALGVSDRSVVVERDLFRWFEATAPPARRVDLVFLDPPYRMVRERTDDLLALGEKIARNHLAEEGLAVFRHDASDRLELPLLESADQRNFGDMMIELMRRSRAD